MGTAGWSKSYDESHWGDPYTFRPERWIIDNGNTAEEVTRLRTFFRPFSSGPGNCVGQNLAMLEMLTTIARTLWRLDVRLAPGSTLGDGKGPVWKGVFQVVDAYISTRDGPLLQFKVRDVGEILRDNY